MIKFLLFSCIFLFSLTADEVSLNDGSLLKGQVIKVHKNVLHMKTEFAGLIKIPMKHVKKLQTDSPVHVKNEHGEILEKKYNSEEDGIDMTVWSGEFDPDVFINKWRRSFWFDLHKKTGNSDEEKVSGGFEVKYIRERDTTKVYGRFSEKTREENRTEDENQFGLDYETLLGASRRHLWYVRADWLQDKIEDLEMRSTYATGYGYYFIKNDSTILRGRSGLQYRIEQFYEDETQENIGLDLGLEFKTKIASNISWYTDIEFSPVFEELDNYIFEHESGLSIPFSLDISMTLKTGVEHSYTSEPAEGFNELDTRYFMRLEIEF